MLKCGLTLHVMIQYIHLLQPHATVFKCVWHGPEKKHTLELKHEAKQIFFHLFQIMCDHKKTLKCTIQLKSLHKSEREVKICAWIQNLLSLIIAMHYIGTAKFPP